MIGAAMRFQVLVVTRDLTPAHRLGSSRRMKADHLRTMIRESDRKPFRVCVDDGKTYVISHPDFAFVADGALILANGPGHNLGGSGFIICYFEHISCVELIRKAKAA